MVLLQFQNNLSEGAEGFSAEDTLATPSKGSSLSTQYIDQNTRKDRSKMIKPDRD